MRRGQQGERNHRKTDDGTCEILQKHYDLPACAGEQNTVFERRTA